MPNLRSLLLDLFSHMRHEAKLALTIDQFDLLAQAVEKGYGIEDWEALKRLCRLIWVKPHESHAQARFESAFDHYRELCQDAVVDALRDDQPIAPLPVEIKLGELPQLPPRLSPSGSAVAPESSSVSPKPEPQQAVTAVKKGTQTAPAQFRLRQLPINPKAVQMVWQRLRDVSPVGQIQELDFERTLARMMQTGVMSDVVLRSVGRRRGDLLLLVDDDNPMLPFRPAVQPLLDAVAQHRIRPAVTYRFTTYPVDYFYQWQQPTEAIAVSTVLSRLHRQRTMAVIVSDAGAASLSYNPTRVLRTGKFLTRLLPCVRDILWLNPLPEERWSGTSAAAIAQALGGRMVPLDLLAAWRLGDIFAGVELWSLVA